MPSMEHVDQKLFAEIKAAVPQELFVRSEFRFFLSVLRAYSLLALSTYISAKLIPFEMWAWPLWVLYAFYNGTITTGLWELSHELGHNAMSSRRWVNTVVGYSMHSFLLVPYFTWQHSHAVHHARTNHLTEGETHVPRRIGEKKGSFSDRVRRALGDDAFSIIHIIILLSIGWWAYIFAGVSSGPAYGKTNHFVPHSNNKLYPRHMWHKFWTSSIGLGAMLFVLYYLSTIYGADKVFVLYFGPYMVTNGWLIMYTYLQHTDKNVPHYDHTSWTWLKGALSVIERNYPEWINWLHFEMGSSHIVHHLFPTIPHYNLRAVRAIIEKKFAHLYRYDQRPFYEALFSTVKGCATVKESSDHPGVWYYTMQS